MSLCVINGNGLLVQMLEDVRNYRRIFDAGNHLDLSTTTLTGFDIDIEHALEALHPGHGTMLFLRALVEPIRTACLNLCCFLTTLCGSDLTTMFAVGRKNTVKSCEINSWLGHQGCELRDKVQGLEDDVCGAIAIRGFEFIPNLAVGG